MARPAAGSPSARDRIADVAGSLFHARGIQRVGIDEVIDKSGVARMTLYHHFASKQAFVDAVVERRGIERMLELDAVTSTTRDARRILEAGSAIALRQRPMGKEPSTAALQSAP